MKPEAPVTQTISNSEPMYIFTPVDFSPLFFLFNLAWNLNGRQCIYVVVGASIYI
jgi:hypothetical protein